MSEDSDFNSEWKEQVEHKVSMEVLHVKMKKYGRG